MEGERRFLFWAWLVAIPVLSTGFPALIHTSLTDTAVALTWTIRNFTGRQLTPTKYLAHEEENQTPWKTCTTVRSPYNSDKLAYKTLFKDGSMSFSLYTFSMASDFLPHGQGIL
jgi:hypothetical protein